MSEREHWSAHVEVRDGRRLMRAFSKMAPSERTEFIRMAERRAGTVENYMTIYLDGRRAKAANGGP